jgi:hypothetical protein
MTNAELALVLQEVLAWRERFPHYVYRPQDDCVALKLDPRQDKFLDLKIAYAEGAQIQMDFDGHWEDVIPQWAPNRQYRIKPQG